MAQEPGRARRAPWRPAPRRGRAARCARAPARRPRACRRRRRGLRHRPADARAPAETRLPAPAREPALRRRRWRRMARPRRPLPDRASAAAAMATVAPAPASCVDSAIVPHGEASRATPRPAPSRRASGPRWRANARRGSRDRSRSGAHRRWPVGTTPVRRVGGRHPPSAPSGSRWPSRLPDSSHQAARSAASRGSPASIAMDRARSEGAAASASSTAISWRARAVAVAMRDAASSARSRAATSIVAATQPPSWWTVATTDRSCACASRAASREARGPRGSPSVGAAATACSGVAVRAVTMIRAAPGPSCPDASYTTGRSSKGSDAALAVRAAAGHVGPPASAAAAAFAIPSSPAVARATRPSPCAARRQASSSAADGAESPPLPKASPVHRATSTSARSARGRWASASTLRATADKAGSCSSTGASITSRMASTSSRRVRGRCGQNAQPPAGPSSDDDRTGQPSRRQTRLDQRRESDRRHRAAFGRDTLGRHGDRQRTDRISLPRHHRKRRAPLAGALRGDRHRDRCANRRRAGSSAARGCQHGERPDAPYPRHCTRSAADRGAMLVACKTTSRCRSPT